MADTGDTGKSTSKKAPGHKFQAPKGTRDFYPEDMLRKRYIVETWRAVSLRHGFEEIDGPTFEHLELYTVKSGEGIVSELFSFRREGGEDAYALRPEFTPTLARMYAARAAQLPKPVRWFCVPSFFRAERPQRGRLREFLQWNCDVIGGDFNAEGAENAEKKKSEADGEIVGVAVGALVAMGLTGHDASARIGDRTMIDVQLADAGIAPKARESWYALIDRQAKLDDAEFEKQAIALAGSAEVFRQMVPALSAVLPMKIRVRLLNELGKASTYKEEGQLSGLLRDLSSVPMVELPGSFGAVARTLRWMNALQWFKPDWSIVRGLAYYTGMVFEVIAEGERAVAGGGRYDNLIELLGGPPTPAVGFAMGDVVLANLLDDKKLMPTAAELPEAVEAVVRSQRIRPEVLVASNGDEVTEPMVTPVVARLRRGLEREGFAGKPWEFGVRYTVRPMHVRTSTKNPKRLNKVLEDAEKQGARFAAIIHGDNKVQVRDLDKRQDVAEDLSVEASAGERYVGRVLEKMLG